MDYFDSYGNMKAPLELQKYLCGNYVAYNRTSYQSVDSDSKICGHLCLAFLMIK